jgi:hypothetical protein
LQFVAVEELPPFRHLSFLIALFLYSFSLA